MSEAAWTADDCRMLRARELYGVRSSDLWERRTDLARAKEWLWSAIPKSSWDGGDEARRLFALRLLFVR